MAHNLYHVFINRIRIMMTYKTYPTIQTSDCKCHKPPLLFSDYKSRLVGIDTTNGRYGEVTIEKCVHCKSRWLHYLVEYESFSRSGRWYRGLISKKTIKTITPENAVDVLKSLEWYLYGGSYFSSTGQKGQGHVNVDR